jgi:hypothetical protein
MVLPASVVIAALFCCAPYRTDAGGDSVTNQTTRATAENTEVLADIALFNRLPNMVGMTKSADALAKQEAKDKHSNYIKDHLPLFSKVAPGRDVNDYMDKMDFSFGAAAPTVPVIFSRAYESRVAEFQGHARDVLKGNNIAAGDIKSSQDKISRLKSASDGADAYVRLIQSGGQISTFLGQELSKLRVDIARQLQAEAEFTLNEQEERKDELLAFEQALKSWTDSGSVGEGY